MNPAPDLEMHVKCLLSGQQTCNEWSKGLGVVLEVVVKKDNSMKPRGSLYKCKVLNLHCVDKRWIKCVS